MKCLNIKKYHNIKNNNNKYYIVNKIFKMNLISKINFYKINKFKLKVNNKLIKKRKNIKMLIKKHLRILLLTKF